MTRSGAGSAGRRQQERSRHEPARSIGVEGFGPVADPDDLAGTFKSALEVVHGGDPAVVDVHISPR